MIAIVSSVLQIIEELYKLKDWNSRLDLVISRTPTEIPHSKRYQRLLVTAGYYRVKALVDQKPVPEGALKALTTLLRPTELTMQLADDYGVSKVSKYKFLTISVTRSRDMRWVESAILNEVEDLQRSYWF